MKRTRKVGRTVRSMWGLHERKFEPSKQISESVSPVVLDQCIGKELHARNYSTARKLQMCRAGGGEGRAEGEHGIAGM